MKRNLMAALLASAGMCLASGAFAAEVAYGAQLSGKHESPTNDSPATGSADMRFNTETRELTWTIDFKDLTGPSIGAHIHGAASPGTNAGVLIPFTNPTSPITGSATLTETQAQALEDGKLYVNIHTSKHPGGEVRGQLERK